MDNFTPKKLTLEDVNYCLWRYFQESNFTFTQRIFEVESSILQSEQAKKNNAPEGELVSLIQKGLQYKEITEEYLRQQSNDSINEDQLSENQNEVNKWNLFDQQQVSILYGHTSEVNVCQWSPTENLLASGSGDSTARIWKILDTTDLDLKSREIQKPHVLQHLYSNEKVKDVTSLHWNHDGKYLATGSYDGRARIWTSTGEPKTTYSGHSGPIFSLKWNSTGEYLLSGSVDKTTIVWDINTGEIRQQFDFHNGPTLDVDWLDERTFASCGTDKIIQICQLDSSKPIKTFSGHLDEVNNVKWNDEGSLLASCSDDHTVKIWKMSEDSFLYSFEEHTKEVNSINWNRNGLLATGGFDFLIKVWDPNVMECVYTLDKHESPVYSIAFSPDGRYLASGSLDKLLHIWSVKDGRLLRTYQGKSGIFEVSWNKDGDKIAASFNDGTLAVIELRKGDLEVLNN
ncbi:wd40 repeat protein [Anaeramoeba flamelloides]|uniref:Wd40 repeat protein n=1 Tax=Anaeramoeba flamelloides TaxID=1746091 RepID=A0AAV7YBJ0_9EUKA|nr:wd40 repeat protein [Anaeramoeba flamelloides]